MKFRFWLIGLALAGAAPVCEAFSSPTMRKGGS